ncbi:GNAT family N-acetyltransferase [bacterium]|nr:GNAT family N-acetyltransferase [bacterium]
MPERIPPPIFTAITVGEMTGKTGEIFDVVIGLDEERVSQLKKYSLDMSDTDLQENTSDYARFGEGSYEEWYAKGRTPFALIHKATGILAALIWLGPEPLGTKSIKYGDTTKKDAPLGDWHTIAFRAYNPYRGQGLMKNFALQAIEIYTKYFPSARIWAGINAKNAASIALSEKIGLHTEESVSDGNWTAMVSS